MTSSVVQKLKPLLSVTNVSKSYDSFLAVKNISFEINKQEIVAILGQNGAGKSTTIKMLAGLLKPSAGDIRIFDTSYFSDSHTIKKKIGYMPEESATYLDVTVKEYLLFFSDLLGIERFRAEKQIKTYSTLLELDAENKKLGDLSKGMRRKVLLIRSLLHDPEVLIYDEPASGLDPKTTQTILFTLLDLKKKGKTIIFSSHNLDHVKKISDRILIIKNGVKVADSSLQDLIKNEQKSYVITTKSGKKTVSFTELEHAVKKGDVLDIYAPEVSLEDLYLSYVKD